MRARFAARGGRLALIALLALGFTGPSAIAAIKQEVPEATRGEKDAVSEPTRVELDRAISLGQNGDCKGALAILDKLLPTVPNPSETRSVLQSVRGLCLGQSGRLPEAEVALIEARGLYPGNGAALLPVIVEIQHLQGRDAAAAGSLIELTKVQPAFAARFDAEMVAQIASNVRKSGDAELYFNLAYSLMQVDFQGGEGPVGIPWLKADAMRGLAERGRIDEARAHLASIVEPQTLVKLAIDRRFEPLWPDIEAAIGPRMATINARYLGIAKGRYEMAAVKDSKVRLAYLDALDQVGEAQAAISLGTVIGGDQAAIDALDDAGRWLVNGQAQAMGDAGHIDDALKRYHELNTVTGPEHSGLTGTTINEALFAVSVNRPEVALTVIARLEANGPPSNDYGNAFVAQAKSCALYRLGRTTESEAVISAMLAKPDANADALLDALLCTAHFDRAETMTLARLADPVKRASMLLRLQPSPFAFTEDRRDKALGAALATLAARPAVAAAIQKYGRILPEPLRQQ